MSYPPGPEGPTQIGPFGPIPPQPPQRRKRHILRNAFLIIGGGAFMLIVAGIVIGVAGGNKPVHHAAAASSTPAPVVSTPPVENPDARYSFSGDYVIPAGIYDHVNLTGEADIHNTGNVGVALACTIRWQREGLAPLKQTRQVKVGTGARVVLRFKRDVGSFSGAGGTVISSIQSWQASHMSQPWATGTCSLLNTFGTAS